MKTKFRLANLHVYQKVILIFILLIVPLLLINLRMNTTGAAFIKKEYTNSINSNVKFYSRQLNDQIAFIRNLQLQFLNDSDLQKLSFIGKRLEGYEQFQLVNRVRERLLLIQNSSEFLVNSGVYVKSLEKTFSVRAGIRDLPNAEYEAIASYRESEQAQPVYSKSGRLYFIASSNNGRIVSYMEISKPKLEETLRRFVENYEDSGAALTNDDFTTTIAVKMDRDIFSQMQKQVAGTIAIPPDDPTRTDTLRLGNHKYLITSSDIQMLGMTIFTYINQNEVLGPIRTFNFWYIILSTVSVGVLVVFSFSVNVMIHRPLKRLIEAFKILETDNLNISIRPQGDIEFGYLYRSFDRMVDKLRGSIQENYEQKIALQHSELKQLQSQINPHFLYNSFFNIYMISRSGDAENAATLAQRLGSYYQFITRSGSDEVTLDQEYRHAVDYCDIQGIRFSNRITIEAAKLPEVCKPLLVPRLLIQPVVENAFEHAFEDGMRRGNVTVKVEYEEDTLCISVEDDGDTLTDEALELLHERLADVSASQEKTGLFNVCRRIRLKFGQRSGIFVSRSALGGLKADMIIHFNEMGD
ncbi:sensor histidine kinase [Paenibacillus sp. BC26]|uniref:sensor histidine kinase n=1 Tax=Paenibacillus sp. BC26 TaxID=1881032 RepID=UPI0008E091E3|nr:histidine kinase [Paenibacillus sp. BC26]SFT03855.1 two-component system, sensor histidine kinase YesM [Paenibacillus sp. BC26]